jgi:hypothetical protein
MQEIDLATVCGGNANVNQAQLRSLAQRYCPQTFAQHRNAPITRPLAERCLAEANMTQYSGMLDRYFPPRR